MGIEAQDQWRIQYHKKSRARSYRRKPNNIVKSFYVNNLSSYSYINPEKPSHSYNLRSLAHNNSTINNPVIHGNMDPNISLGDIVTLLSEKSGARGLTVREIRNLLIQKFKISSQITEAQVREVLKRGIRKRRIKKIIDEETYGRRRHHDEKSDSGKSETSHTSRERESKHCGKRRKSSSASHKERHNRSRNRSESKHSRISHNRNGSKKRVSKWLQADHRMRRFTDRSRSRSRGGRRRETAEVTDRWRRRRSREHKHACPSHTKQDSHRSFGRPDLTRCQ
ncbi:hypothetical protein PoB_002095500 [Plakobranchus ocellatus]|uniref:Uncharacterized protein n=1 Tax=Plakobranchus ocellatus TaxID=259542 RepID=A0AAV3ZIQ5_9GAST|nr:hypothetical protein PoB_002095500 [Plakobranchus ocellatus]